MSKDLDSNRCLSVAFSKQSANKELLLGTQRGDFPVAKLSVLSDKVVFDPTG